MNNINQPCHPAINQLIDEMEKENFGKKDLAQIVKQFPDCEKALLDTYGLWEELTIVAVPAPRHEMSANFYKKLNEYPKQQIASATSKNELFSWFKNWNFGNLSSLNWAFSICFLLIGFLFGHFNQPKSDLEDQIKLLTYKIQKIENQKATSVNLEGSVASRLKNIQLVRQEENPNSIILDALNTALCKDPNVNVRLSAIESLVHFSDDPAVREILIRAIPIQKSSLVQLELAVVMTQLEEKRSATQWRELLDSDNVELDVKMQLKETLQVLL